MRDPVWLPAAIVVCVVVTLAVPFLALAGHIPSGILLAITGGCAAAGMAAHLVHRRRMPRELRAVVDRGEAAWGLIWVAAALHTTDTSRLCSAIWAYLLALSAGVGLASVGAALARRDWSEADVAARLAGPRYAQRWLGGMALLVAAALLPMQLPAMALVFAGMALTARKLPFGRPATPDAAAGADATE